MHVRASRISRLRFFTRFRFSRVCLILFVLFWSLGIWAGYHPEDQDGFDAEMQANAFQAIDRNLRLSDACADQPAWIRLALFCDDRASALGVAQDALLSLSEQGQLDCNGRNALEVISRQLDESNDPNQEVSAIVKKVLNNRKLSREDVQNLEIGLDQPSAKWWDLELGKIARKQYEIDDFNEELAAQQVVNHQLYQRALWGQGLSYVTFFLGLFLLPAGYRALRQQWPVNTSPRPIRYHLQWAPVLLLALFFASQLGGDWVIEYVYRLSQSLAKGFVFEAVVDSLWRVLPPLIVLCVIFRSPRLMIRSLGLIKKPSWAIIFAVFSVLVMIDPLLAFLLDGIASSDPSGGLDRMENGWKGLCYGIFSACIVAPIAEELAYRGLLFNALLRRTGFFIAAGLASLVFALAHNYDIYGTVSVGVFGFACAFVYRATGSLINTILLHAIYNFTITVPVWLIYHYGA